MDRDNRPLAEQWHDAAMAHVDAEAAASMLEETKSAVLAEMVSDELRSDPKMSVAKAETTVKASRRWREHVEGIVRARKAANRARVSRDYLKMRFSQWISEDANHRAGARV
ncbi:hypothetical protein [Microvirga alba]|uniref:Uncharacterized protein n=1 Tax=Microvirga alba TaxID=2791025 RepID=A0A931BSP9_9HYPH|nr:hypothetical protein [Microvirga alba]MBF9233958.1 hypothetical protein [Microvirga alba]